MNYSPALPPEPDDKYLVGLLNMQIMTHFYSLLPPHFCLNNFKACQFGLVNPEYANFDTIAVN